MAKLSRFYYFKNLYYVYRDRSCASSAVIMRSHGIIPINLSALQDVFRATVVAKVTYCAPAWSGTCSAANRVRLDSFLNRCKQEAKLSRR